MLMWLRSSFSFVVGLQLLGSLTQPFAATATSLVSNGTSTTVSGPPRGSSINVVKRGAGILSSSSRVTNESYPDEKVSRRLNDRKRVTFYVMGDAPYDSDERERFPKQIRNIPNNGDFIVHLGDMKGKDSGTSDRPYSLVSDAMKESRTPGFLVPGDNDYYDCDKPDAAWERWKKYFMRFHVKHWKNRKPWVSNVQHQKGREENFSFMKRGVLFIGVHLVGSGDGISNKREWKRLLRDALEWTQQEVSALSNARVFVIFGHASPSSDHKLYFDGLSALAKEQDKPFLYMHGDSHRWKKDRPFEASNILRVVVDQGGKADPVRVVINVNGKTPDISFERRLLTKRFLRVTSE